ncbi:MAG: UvrD-helicase domain-containing protein [Prevotellaceae bacterium]|jgi:ATP-dependent exoDNAse (exonuclease V) beta subunit|nr:UvrD-helicase domain-containing protein [Prevotellaceae bacterium]
MSDTVRLNPSGDSAASGSSPDGSPAAIPLAKHHGLTVYEASAGSGKTYTLTLEYLRQALSDGHNAGRFRTVLAVTFTNKATDEMKTRIINTLNSLVSDCDSAIAASLCSELGIDKRTLRLRAAKVRRTILHDYSSFSVFTIDKFFQKVIHAFVREAGLRPGFRLELDQNRLMDETVDRMMMNLHKNEFLYRHTLRIIDEQMEKGNSWDIGRTLKKQGGEILKERFRALDSAFHRQIMDTAFMEHFSETVDGCLRLAKSRMSDSAANAIRMIEDAGLEKSNFRYGAKGPVNYFYKLKEGHFDEPGKRTLDMLESSDEAWIAGKNVSSPVRSSIMQIAGLLTESLRDAIGIYRQYCTAACVRKSMDILGFLAGMETAMHETAIDRNLMPVSETTHLLGKLINESDAPFIYEMTGSGYSVFMIDEFQDTSDAQWHNFKPLLKNSLAEGKDSIVAGDVKQAIYRWRNGDWRILSDRIFSELGDFHIQRKYLDTNWRSFPRVVEFNNALFSALPAHIENILAKSLGGYSAETGMLSAAYKNARQKTAGTGSDRGGYVALALIRDGKGENRAPVKAKNKILEQLPKLVADLQDRGYRAKDIAILVRKTSEGQEVSDCLLNYGSTRGDAKHCFDIVSDDALSISKSATVQFIIALMRAAVNPDDRINNASVNCFMKGNISGFKWSEAGTQDCGLKEKLSGLTALSLPEVFEYLVGTFNLGNCPADVPYMQELHDMMISFATDELSDIPSFIEYWDDVCQERKLSGGQAPDAISIVTVHKAKGLEYPAVIIPFCSWSMKPSSRDTMWVSPGREPFSRLQHALVNCGTEMKNSYFDEEYCHETMQSAVDNLNLMYVAFTRAREELHVMLPLPGLSNGKTSGAVSASSTLSSFLADNPDFMDGKAECTRLSGDDMLYSYGHKQYRTTDTGSQNSGETVITAYTSSAFNKKLRLKYESENCFCNSSEMLPRDYGILMHKIFSLIRSAKDVPEAMERIENDGLIGKEHIAELENRIARALNFAGKWFDDNSGYTVVTEKSLLVPATLDRQPGRRPDRVMIADNETILVDYKFGTLKKDAYRNQVKDYIRLLETMKYPNVKGYLWYVDLNLIEETVQ